MNCFNNMVLPAVFSTTLLLYHFAAFMQYFVVKKLLQFGFKIAAAQ